MRSLKEVMLKYQDHEKLFHSDRTRIAKTLIEFDQELLKVANPISEKFEKVEKRVVKADEGNPSDSNYKPQNANFKVEVKSNRNKVIPNEKLDSIPEEKHITVANLSTNALDYLDDLFAAAQEPPKVEAPDMKIEVKTEKFVEDRASVILDKSVLKKKVRFQEPEEADEDKLDEGYEADTPVQSEATAISSNFAE